jgi:hypothetical protein
MFAFILCRLMQGTGSLLAMSLQVLLGVCAIAIVFGIRLGLHAGLHSESGLARGITAGYRPQG